MKKLLILFIALVIGFESMAQQDPLFTQYAFNQIALNPGVAGSHSGMSFTAMSRMQASSIAGSPETHIFSAHTALRNNRMGVGLTFFNDQIGVTKQNEVGLVYSYSLKFENSTLSFGANASFNFFKIDLTEVDLGGVIDPSFQGAEINDFGVNFGAGAYYYSDRYYVGLSMPYVTKNTFEGNSDIAYTKDRSYYLLAGYVFDLTKDLKIKPYTNVKMPVGAPIQVDINASLIYHDEVYLGFGIRPNDSISAMFEWQINNFRIGYAADFSSNNSDIFGNNAHEFMLNILLPTKKDVVANPRYF